MLQIGETLYRLENSSKEWLNEPLYRVFPSLQVLEVPPPKIPLPDTSLNKNRLGGTKAHGWREEKAGINLIIALEGREAAVCMKHHLGGFWGSPWPEELWDIAEQAAVSLQLPLFTRAGRDCSGLCCVSYQL